jgi:hypothetical protein
MLFAASAADTEAAWYCDLDLSRNSRDSVVLLSRPAGPAELEIVRQIGGFEELASLCQVRSGFVECGQ